MLTMDFQAIRKLLFSAAFCFTSALLPVAEICTADDFSSQRMDNWHQWRGPLANGIAPHGDPPVQWGEGKNIKWRVELPGEGHATPIVWGDRIFAVAAVATDRQVDRLAPPEQEPPGGYMTRRPTRFYQFRVFCLDRGTGAILWQQVACEALPHEGRHETNSYASASPTTDGKRLYVSFGSRGLFCYDLDGNRLWDRDLGRMITRLGWGEGASPVVHGDNLIVNWDHEGQSFLVVLDPATGETKWRVERDEVTSWTTPLPVEYQGRTQLIVPATGRITSYDLATGEIVWQCGGMTTNVIPTPLVYGETVICMSGHRGSAAVAVRLDSRGNVTDDSRQIVWRLQRDTPYVPSPILYGDLLYFTKSNTPILTCVEPSTGKVLTDGVRLPGMQSLYASPVAAAGRIYFTSREGVTLVVKNQSSLEVLATNRLPDGIDASPAIVGNELFLRTRRHLVCVAEP
jgi:outer membrane protein assembly factor BamB